MGYYLNLGARWIIAFILLFSEGIFYPLMYVLTFYPSVFILGLVFDVSYKGNIIMVGNKLIEIIPECVAVLAYILLAILILLTKDVKIKTGIKIFFIGSLMILAFNILRIDLLIFILVKYGADYFNSVHIFVWKFMSGFYVGLVWIFLSYKYHVKNVPLVSDVVYLYKTVKNKKGRA